MSQTAPAFQFVSWLAVLAGLASCLFVAIDIRRRQSRQNTEPQ